MSSHAGFTEAAIDPRHGGRYQMSWDGAWDWSGTIRIWEPGRHLQIAWPREHAVTADGQVADRMTTPEQTVLDYILESRHGETVVRLVHSGFGRGASWDDEFDGISRGWPFELRNLRFYFQQHRGQDRSLIWAIATSHEPLHSLWRRLFGPGGLTASPGMFESRVGDPIVVTLPSGVPIVGSVYYHTPGLDLSARVPALGDGVVRISVEPAVGQTAASMWFATWGEHRGKAEALRAEAQPRPRGCCRR